MYPKRIINWPARYLLVTGDKTEDKVSTPFKDLVIAFWVAPTEEKIPVSSFVRDCVIFEPIKLILAVCVLFIIFVRFPIIFNVEVSKTLLTKLKVPLVVIIPVLVKNIDLLDIVPTEEKLANNSLRVLLYIIELSVIVPARDIKCPNITWEAEIDKEDIILVFISFIIVDELFNIPIIDISFRGKWETLLDVDKDETSNLDIDLTIEEKVVNIAIMFFSIVYLIIEVKDKTEESIFPLVPIVIDEVDKEENKDLFIVLYKEPILDRDAIIVLVIDLLDIIPEDISVPIKYFRGLSVFIPDVVNDPIYVLFMFSFNAPLNEKEPIIDPVIDFNTLLDVDKEPISILLTLRSEITPEVDNDAMSVCKNTRIIVEVPDDISVPKNDLFVSLIKVPIEDRVPTTYFSIVHDPKTPEEVNTPENSLFNVFIKVEVDATVTDFIVEYSFVIVLDRPNVPTIILLFVNANKELKETVDDNSLMLFLIRFAEKDKEENRDLVIDVFTIEDVFSAPISVLVKSLSEITPEESRTLEKYLP